MRREQPVVFGLGARRTSGGQSSGQRAPHSLRCGSGRKARNTGSARSGNPSGHRRRPFLAISNRGSHVRALGQHSLSHYRSCHAAYDLKKLRGKQIVRRINRTRRYQPLPEGLRAITALFVLTNKAIKPLLATAQPLRPTRGAQNPRAIDAHYHAVRVAMRGLFDELGVAA